VRTIELLYFDGCPGYEEIVPVLRRLAADASAELTLRAVDTQEQAERERFLGSPTILVDGRDVAPADGQPVGLACRVYRLRDGRPSPTPDRDDVRDAIRSAL